MYTPEEKLARTMRTVYRKTEYPKTDKHKSDLVKRVSFSEPVYIGSSSGIGLGLHHAGYVVTSSGDTLCDSSIVLMRMMGGPSVEPETHHSTSGSSGSSSSFRTYGSSAHIDTYVPDYLKTRGIVHAGSTPTSSSSVKCGAIGCSIRHPSHYCNVCDNWNVKHKEEDCPLYKNIRY